MNLRHVLAIAAGKVARLATRLRGGGSAFPGYVANRIAPSLLPSLSGRFTYGVVFVLGSNGKTTTTHMVSEVLRAHGLTVFTNPTGANLPQGVTSALLAEATVFGRVKADVAVLEVDEGYAVDLARVLRPRVITALNTQVDQLYRFYETERVADMMLDTAVLATEHAIVNRDDPYLSKIDTTGVAVTFFGVSQEVLASSAHGLVNAVDTRSESMGPMARIADAEVTGIDGRVISLEVADTPMTVTIPARGLHYAIDAAAAIATADRVLGKKFDRARAADGFAAMQPAYGRGETVPLGRAGNDEPVEFVMFKNAPSLQLNLDALAESPDRLLMAIDEGTPDISWIYDVDFSRLTHVDVVTGEKAHQIATRLLYAGVHVGAVEPDMSTAIETMRSLAPSSSGRQLWLVNYELMMEGRRLLGHGDQEVARR